jgi:hypothetical protein
MVRLRAKGESEYVASRQVPHESASAETRVVLAAFRAAVEGLLARAVTEGKSEPVRAGLLLNLVMMRRLYDEMHTDLEQLGFILQVTEQKLKALEG